MKKMFFALGLYLFLAVPLSAQWTKPEPLEAGVTLRLIAPVDAQGGQPLSLHITTNDPYDCKDARFENVVSVGEKKVSIKIQGISWPEDCEQKLAPVTLPVDLSALGSGSYPIRVTINRQFFKANLTVAEDHFRLTTDEDPDLFSVANTRLNKVPEGSIWGHCTYSDPSQKAQAEAFMAAILEAGASKIDLAPGDYGEFYIHFGGAPSESSIGPDRYDFPFVYRYDGSPKDFADLVKEYAGEMEISLRSHLEVVE